MTGVSMRATEHRSDNDDKDARGGVDEHDKDAT